MASVSTGEAQSKPHSSLSSTEQLIKDEDPDQNSTNNRLLEQLNKIKRAKQSHALQANAESVV